MTCDFQGWKAERNGEQNKMEMILLIQHQQDTTKMKCDQNVIITFTSDHHYQIIHHRNKASTSSKCRCIGALITHASSTTTAMSTRNCTMDSCESDHHSTSGNNRNLIT